MKGYYYKTTPLYFITTFNILKWKYIIGIKHNIPKLSLEILNERKLIQLHILSVDNPKEQLTCS